MERPGPGSLTTWECQRQQRSYLDHAAYERSRPGRSHQKSQELAEARRASERLQRRALRALERYEETGTVPTTGRCGCRVELDGSCPHGNVSVVMAAGLL